MRHLALIALAGLFAWLTATAFAVALSPELLTHAGPAWWRPVSVLLAANQRLLYVGGAIGLLATVLSDRSQRLPRQWLSWLLLAAFVYVATIAAQHVLSMRGYGALRDFLPRNWVRVDLAVAAIGTALLTPLTVSILGWLVLALQTLGRPRLRAHSSDVDFDGTVDHEGIARAEAWLAERRKTRAAGAGKGDWTLTPRE